MSDHPGFVDDDFDVAKPPEVVHAEREPDNVGNSFAIRTKKQKQKANDNERVSSLKRLLADPNQRAWLASVIFETCGVLNPTENAAYHDGALHYREGARGVGLVIQRDLVLADPKAYALLVTEHLTQGKEP